ncbi:hypothetical protein VFPPC_18411 [Pochonia chlamydosporia 170]|uniref:Carboxylesterase type B domain-containing protein n=1 Tax=Pochonia chlamydosporia 170 TaxID=1380566 RepID=A0A219AQ43_METCM|nr:hypothetical protein VFPPC_18411 [Pochonia chlamydosporia 170]OWT42434.1 hypothetical protein VFPPC_18411 [Pochonia chlamydosporia 170]
MESLSLPGPLIFKRSQVAFVFYNINGDGYTVNPFGGDDHTYSRKARALAKEISSMWINFIVDQNPNGYQHQSRESGRWPTFDPTDGGGAGRGIVFELDHLSVELDDWRAEGINWLIQNDLALIGN